MSPCPVPPTFRQTVGGSQEEGKDKTPALGWTPKFTPCCPPEPRDPLCTSLALFPRL